MSDNEHNTYLPVDEDNGASIINWDISLRSRNKDQLIKIVTDILNLDWTNMPSIAIDHDHISNDNGATVSEFTLIISAYPWAENLKEIVDIIQKYDYKF